MTKNISLILSLFLIMNVVAKAQKIEPINTEKKGVPNATWVSIYFSTFDSVVVSAGLKPLRDKKLPKYKKEIRIWTGVSIGVPKNLFRIVKTKNNVKGELIYYWPVRSTKKDPAGDGIHDLTLYNLKGSCDNFNIAAGIATCNAIFITEPNWSNILAKIKKAGIWSLPDHSKLVAMFRDTTDNMIHISLDGWQMTVELKDANSYRTYQYDNPAHKSWPEAKKASKIASILGSIHNLVKRPNVVKVYRGRTSGEYGSAIHLCDINKTLELRYDVKYYAKKSGIPIPDSGQFGYIVEVLGISPPKWLAEDWESKYPRVLQGLKVISIQPATKPTCK